MNLFDKILYKDHSLANEFGVDIKVSEHFTGKKFVFRFNDKVILKAVIVQYTVFAFKVSFTLFTDEEKVNIKNNNFTWKRTPPELFIYFVKTFVNGTVNKELRYDLTFRLKVGKAKAKAREEVEEKVIKNLSEIIQIPEQLLQKIYKTKEQHGKHHSS